MKLIDTFRWINSIAGFFFTIRSILIIDFNLARTLIHTPGIDSYNQIETNCKIYCGANLHFGNTISATQLHPVIWRGRLSLLCGWPRWHINKMKCQHMVLVILNETELREWLTRLQNLIELWSSGVRSDQFKFDERVTLKERAMHLKLLHTTVRAKPIV